MAVAMKQRFRSRALLKRLGRGALALLLLTVAAAGAGYLWIRGSLPVIDGERAVPGLTAPVEIVRDRHGIPHVLAGNEEDALFALGYVHAQDRLWQMEMNRRIGAGRLAEVLGSTALDTDRLLRVLGLHRRAKATLPHLEPESRRRIAAYVDGVNAWIETREGPLPPEFLLLGFEPDAWTAADTLVWARVMALDLGREWARDLMRLRMSKFLPPDRILDFYTPYRPDKPRGVVLPGSPAAATANGPPVSGAPSRPERASHRAVVTTRGPVRLHAGGPAADAPPPLADSGFPGGRPDRLAALVPDETPAPLPHTLRPRSGHPGSNSWAVGGARSATGKPLLANDPHLGLTVPSVWYFAHLSWPGRDVVGATFPGMPMVVLGHNGRVAWGFTNTASDVQDLFIEKVDPDDPGRYLTPTGYRPFDVRREIIEVKDGEDVAVRVRETRHGPVLDDALASAAGAAPAGHVLALAWTALRDDDLTLQAGLGLPEVGDWAGFVAILRDFHAPQQNVSYADVDGNIGFLAPGRVPIRRSGAGGHTGTRSPESVEALSGECTGSSPEKDPSGNGETRIGTMPRPGWDASCDWQGFIPFEALPRVYNPPGGAIVTANHSVVTRDYPHHLTFEWAAGFRAERIMERLAALPRHDLESFRSLQQDRVSPFARALLPRLRGVALDSHAKPLAIEARRLLDGWEGDMDPERPEPLIFHAWIWEFARLVTTDELGPLQREAWGRKGAFILRILESREIWCDDGATARTETCDEMLARALARAVDRVAGRQGDDPAAWRWGREHRVLGEHRPLAHSPLARLFNLEGPAPGSTYTVNSFDFNPLDDERPFTSTHGPSLRAIYDLADLDRSLFIHSTGQSGNVLSPLYRNFEARWRGGGYVTIPTRREAFEAHALGLLRLTPHREPSPATRPGEVATGCRRVSPATLRERSSAPVSPLSGIVRAPGRIDSIRMRNRSGYPSACKHPPHGFHWSRPDFVDRYAPNPSARSSDQLSR